MKNLSELNEENFNNGKNANANAKKDKVVNKDNKSNIFSGKSGISGNSRIDKSEFEFENINLNEDRSFNPLNKENKIN